MTALGNAHPLREEAIKALGIDSPVYRAEVKGNTVTLWLCGHLEPVTWTKPASKRATNEGARSKRPKEPKK